MFPRPMSRRQLLKSASCGFGYLALAGLCASEASAGQDDPLAPKAPHFAPRAKRVIFLFMRGGPSHVDTFDYKPGLAEHDGQSYQGGRKLMQSPWKFTPHGESGLPISELFPHLARHADDLCLLNSLHTDLPNHPQATLQMHTGQFRFVRPSMGAWVQYGLGTENQNLPGFITLNPPSRVGGAQNYGAAFLPASYEGTRIGNEGESLAKVTIAHIHNSRLSRDLQRKQVDLIQQFNQDLLARDTVNNQLEGVIKSYELAFSMQTAVPELLDISRETPATLQAYGIGAKETDNFGRQCLLARRFVEAGVRFVELCHGNWDQHGQLRARLTANCTAIDQPMAALLTDLKQRGLLHDTLVVWGGEFGRTPHVKQNDGRDHNSTGFSMWMAGGGVRGGLRYGATDEHGIEAVENKVHIHDLHATILHLLGLDHTKLTYRYSGRDFRLTDVYGRVVEHILA
jgi:hypothetical protein